MAFTLLQTKLHMPPAPPQMVRRPRLLASLGERTAGHVTLLSAPAGFGKTTLLSEWLGQSDQPIAWLSLDERDNDPARFLAYLIAALQSVQSDIGKTALAALQSAQPPPLEGIIGTLINDLTRLALPLTLVLDDYHVVEAEPIHKALDFLVENLPASLHLIIAGRADPPIPLARLRAHGQLTEIRVNDLRFTTDEAADLLCQVFRLNLSPEHITTLEARTEGWVAGLQMAALSLRGRKDVAGFIGAFGGTHRYILDYLVEQVLGQQPPYIQDFLLRSSILERLTAPLCDALAGTQGQEQEEREERASKDSQQILEYLESSNLFIVPLDDERRWYRYHHLFADLLRYRLQQSIQPIDLTDLHHRAADWLENNGLAADAVSHWLVAGDAARAACLVERIAPELIWGQGQVTTVLRWMRELPEEQIRSRPRLSLALAWAQMTALQFDAVQARLHDIERAIGAAGHGDQEALLGEVAALRVMLANFRGDPRIVELCHDALARLPQEALFLRSMILGNLGGAYATRGQVAAARQAFAEASRAGRLIGNTFITLGAHSYLGDMQALQGELHAAMQTYRQVLDLALGQGALQVSFTGLAYVGMGKVSYEWNDLESAARSLTSAIELGEGQGDNLSGPGWLMLASGYLATAQLLQARGDVGRALEMIRNAETLARRHDPSQLGRMAAARARLECASGNLSAAVRWMNESGLSADDAADYGREAEHLVFARVLTAQGCADAALPLLERVQRAAEAVGRKETLIAGLALHALALDSQRKRVEATAVLERALVLAEPEGYVRTFIDLGERLRFMIYDFRFRNEKDRESRLLEYVDRLLAAYPGAELKYPASKSEIINRKSGILEPLSERELEVLRLIVKGDSNREIAQKLVITVSTVKKHASNIFGKLGVTSRSQAIARAREMGMT